MASFVAAYPWLLNITVRKGVRYRSATQYATDGGAEYPRAVSDHADDRLGRGGQLGAHRRAQAPAEAGAKALVVGPRRIQLQMVPERGIVADRLADDHRLLVDELAQAAGRPLRRDRPSCRQVERLVAASRIAARRDRRSPRGVARRSGSDRPRSDAVPRSRPAPATPGASRPRWTDPPRIPRSGMSRFSGSMSMWMTRQPAEGCPCAGTQGTS